MTSSLLPDPPQAGQYRCLVVDPPWDQGKTGRRCVRPNQDTTLDYKTMTIGELEVLPINEWSDSNSMLWLWATNSRSQSTGNPILADAFQIMETWGFRYYTMLTWDKRTGPCPFGPYQITTEHCLFGYKGKFSPRRSSMGKFKTIFSARSRRHSEKPSILYEGIKQYFDGPRLDVFARRQHHGFDCWGDEVMES